MQPESSRQWDEYAHLQSRSSRISRIDSYAWGVEAAMDRLLDSSYPSAADSSPVSIANTLAAAARRERHRARLRFAHQAEIYPSHCNLISTLEARHAITVIRSSVSPRDWLLLLALASGYSGRQLSEALALSPGQLRVKVFRLRQRIAGLLKQAA